MNCDYQISRCFQIWVHSINQNVSPICTVSCLINFTWRYHVVPGIFGTFNRTTANSSEVQLSDTLQTIVGSFAKNPFAPPLPSWPKYNPNSTTLAKLAFNGNVATTDVVQTASPASEDQTCSALWDKILASPPTGVNFV